MKEKVEKVKRILMGLRTLNNSHVVNHMLGTIDTMDDKQIIQLFGESIENDGEIQAMLEEKINSDLERYVKSGHFNYYSNAKEDNRESRTFSQISNAYKKVREVLEKEGLTAYVAGGSVPYFLLDEDSHRMHDDIDTVCSLEDVDKIREAFKKAGLYNPEMDSKTYAKDGQDYGFETMVDGVPVGFSPFIYDGQKLTQRSYDPYTHQCKAQAIELESLDDYVTSYKSRDGITYQTMSLEYIKKTKQSAVGRPKDKMDSDAIDRTGLLRQEVYDRIKLPRLVYDSRTDDEMQQ